MMPFSAVDWLSEVVPLWIEKVLHTHSPAEVISESCERVQPIPVANRISR